MEHDDAQPVEVKRVPVDQVKDLTPEQLNEVFTKAITATNPNVPKATTRFHFREGAFKLDGTVEHLTVHFSMESSLVFADSNEARQQPADEAKAAGGDAAPLGGGGNSAERRSVGTSPALEGAAAAGAAAPADGAAEAGGEPHSPVTKDKKLRNQFNFNERSMRTVNNPLRDREVMTEPPPTRDYSGSVTQWGIFDQYLSDLKAQIAAKEQKEREQGGRFAQGSSSETDSKAVSAAVLPPNGALAAERERLMKSPGFAHAIKILERMVTQNEQDDTFRDFKYFEDEQDTLREDARGELLPLWRFLFAEAKRKVRIPLPRSARAHSRSCSRSPRELPTSSRAARHRLSLHCAGTQCTATSSRWATGATISKSREAAWCVSSRSRTRHTPRLSFLHPRA
jgi:dynein intermediate chain 1